MRKFFGLISYLLATSFASGLLISISGASFNYLPGSIAFANFFCCGIPTILVTAVTFTLWHDCHSYIKVVGWTSLFFSVLATILFIAFITIRIALRDSDGIFSYFIAYWVPIIISGLYGVEIVFERQIENFLE